MMKINGQKVPLETMLLATIADRLSTLVWLNSEDGRKGRNRPASILSELINEKQETKLKTYRTGREFDEARDILLKGAANGQ